ncbi:MAG: DNA cytosine methyltransferase [Chloroflexi bacterium]|nr:DNA cytosine methyltransferase [Chloroflexota bacterium]
MDNIKSPRFLAVDFYCGAGGTTRGLIDAGGYVVAGIDNDSGCEQTYLSNNSNGGFGADEPRLLALDMFPRTEKHPLGQQKEVMSELEDLIPTARQRWPGVPLLFAICAPCQSFTKFVQRNLTSERERARLRDESLLAQALPFVVKFKPELVMIENVMTMRSKASRSIWDGFLNQLRDQDYEADDDGVCASRFGVPQHRKRLIGLAIRRRQGEAALGLRVPTSDPVARIQTVQDAIGDFPPLTAGGSDESVANHQCRNLSPLNRRRLEFLEPGESNRRFAESADGELTLSCHRRLEASGKRGFGDVYTRMRPDRPSPTITTRFLSISNGRFGHWDTEQIRPISLREGAALQSFPDEYEFYAKSMDNIASMIGNAVPPRLASYMAGHLVDVFNTRPDGVRTADEH